MTTTAAIARIAIEAARAFRGVRDGWGGENGKERNGKMKLDALTKEKEKMEKMGESADQVAANLDGVAYRITGDTQELSGQCEKSGIGEVFIGTSEVLYVASDGLWHIVDDADTAALVTGIAWATGSLYPEELSAIEAGTLLDDAFASAVRAAE